jgi:chemotaxis protein methyltransferase CheR
VFINGLDNKTEENIMTAGEYDFLKEIIYREYGIIIKGDKRLTMHTKLSHRLDILGMKSYGEYCDFVRSQPSKEELLNLISHITNNETFFLREKGQLGAFSEILKDIKRKRQRNNQNTLRIVSAGCSTGEELYNLNIILMESGLFAWGWDVSLTGIDVDRNAVRKAEAATYSRNSLRLLNGDEKFIKKYFLAGNEKYKLKQPYKNNVKFVHGNIFGPEGLGGISDVDVIFCRNVLIYMDDGSIDRVAVNLHASLADEGYLFLGASESLIQKTELFVPEYRDGIVVYRKNGKAGF